MVDIEPCFVPLCGLFDQDFVHGDASTAGIADGDNDILTVDDLTKDAVTAFDGAITGGFSLGKLGIATGKDLALKVALASDDSIAKV